jgi:hypothetical protein
VRRLYKSFGVKGDQATKTVASSIERNMGFYWFGFRTVSTKTLRQLSQQPSWSFICPRSYKIAQCETIQLRIFYCVKRHAVYCVERIRFCNTLCGAVCSGEVDTMLTYSTDEAWVCLIDHVNNGNYKYRSTLNPRPVHWTQSHGICIDICSAVCFSCVAEISCLWAQ